MPIILFGTRGITSTLNHGEFYCPRCDHQEEYELKQQRPYFTLFFLPIFPIGRASRYVECAGCGRAFQEDVLEVEPPREADRLLEQFSEEFRTGTSLEVIRRKLARRGMTEEEAEEALLDLCGGRPKTCKCGRRYHPSVRECSECGASL